MEYAVKGEARDGRIVILARGFELIRGRRGSPRQNVGLEACMDQLIASPLMVDDE